MHQEKYLKQNIWYVFNTETEFEFALLKINMTPWCRFSITGTGDFYTWKDFCYKELKLSRLSGAEIYKIEWTLNIWRISIKYLIRTPRVLYSYNHYPSRSPSVKLKWSPLFEIIFVSETTFCKSQYDWLSEFMHHSWETVCGDTLNLFLSTLWYILISLRRFLFPQILSAAKTLHKKIMNIQNLENTM